MPYEREFLSSKKSSFENENAAGLVGAKNEKIWRESKSRLFLKCLSEFPRNKLPKFKVWMKFIILYSYRVEFLIFKLFDSNELDYAARCEEWHVKIKYRRFQHFRDFKASKYEHFILKNQLEMLFSLTKNTWRAWNFFWIFSPYENSVPSLSMWFGYSSPNWIISYRMSSDWTEWTFEKVYFPIIFHRMIRFLFWCYFYRSLLSDNSFFPQLYMFRRFDCHFFRGENAA